MAKRLTEEQKRLRAITEQEYQDLVVEFGHLMGWHFAHFRPGYGKDGWATQVQYDAAGFPDLVAVRERVVFFEVKREQGKTTDRQGLWGEWITEAAAEWYVVRPSDFDAVVKPVLERWEDYGDAL